MPYFHDENETALLGSVSGLICATRKWDFAHFGSGRFLRLRAAAARLLR